jgi:hypothetical protein
MKKEFPLNEVLKNLDSGENFNKRLINSILDDIANLIWLFREGKGETFELINTLDFYCFTLKQLCTDEIIFSALQKKGELLKKIKEHN